MRSRLVVALFVTALAALAPAIAQQVDYSRPVDVAPTEESIGEGYQTPEVQRPLSRSAVRQIVDVGLLAAALALAAWLAIGRRHR
jgi:hypothetical protein